MSIAENCTIPTTVARLQRIGNSSGKGNASVPLDHMAVGKKRKKKKEKMRRRRRKSSKRREGEGRGGRREEQENEEVEEEKTCKL